MKLLLNLHNQTDEQGRILGLISINSIYGVVQHWATVMEPILRNVLLLGQIIVVLVTVRYILKRTRGLPKDQNKEDDDL